MRYKTQSGMQQYDNYDFDDGLTMMTNSTNFGALCKTFREKL